MSLIDGPIRILEQNLYGSWLRRDLSITADFCSKKRWQDQHRRARLDSLEKVKREKADA